MNKKKEPRDAWIHWTLAHRADPKKLAKGRAGIRFKTKDELDLSRGPMDEDAYEATEVVEEEAEEPGAF